MRLLYLLAIVFLIFNLVYPNYFNLEKPYFVIFNILLTIFIGSIMILKQHFKKYQIEIYEKLVSASEKINKNINYLYFLPNKGMFKLNQLTNKKITFQEINELVNKTGEIHNKNSRLIIEFICFMYNYESIFRANRHLYMRINRLHRRTLMLYYRDLQDSIFKLSDDSIESYTKVGELQRKYAELIMDIETNILDLHIFAQNHLLSDMTNIFIPHRRPSDRKFKPTKICLFDKRSFLRNNYDFISRFLWWL